MKTSNVGKKSSAKTRPDWSIQLQTCDQENCKSKNMTSKTRND